MDDPEAGNIDGKGNFIAGAIPGIFAEAVKVEAVVPGERGFVRAVDYASVVVRLEEKAGQLSAMSVEPQTLVITPRTEATFGVRTVDDRGQPAQDVSVEFEVLDPDVGDLGIHGRFTAGKVAGVFPDSVRVTVEQTQGEETIVLTRNVSVVVTGTLTKAEIRPGVATVTPGRTTHFALTAWDENGIELPGLVVLWSLSDADIGTIDAFGNFTAARAPGLYQEAIRAEVVQRLGE